MLKLFYMDKTLMLSKIKEYYNFNSDAEFARHLEIKPQVLSNWKARNSFDAELLYTKCLELNPVWLLTGKGSMLKDINNIVAEPDVDYYKTKGTIHELQRIPIFNLDRTIGLIPVLNKDSVDDEKIIDYLSLNMLPACDGAILATGDSMQPLFKAGDLVAYKNVAVDWKNIFFGEIYLLAIFIDETTTMKTIKFVHPSELGEEYIKITSHSQHHESRDINLSQIAAMGLVRASIRFHN